MKEKYRDLEHPQCPECGGFAVTVHEKRHLFMDNELVMKCRCCGRTESVIIWRRYPEDIARIYRSLWRNFCGCFDDELDAVIKRRLKN